MAPKDDKMEPVALHNEGSQLPAPITANTARTDSKRLAGLLWALKLAFVLVVCGLGIVLAFEVVADKAAYNDLLDKYNDLKSSASPVAHAIRDANYPPFDLTSTDDSAGITSGMTTQSAQSVQTSVTTVNSGFSTESSTTTLTQRVTATETVTASTASSSSSTGVKSATSSTDTACIAASQSTITLTITSTPVMGQTLTTEISETATKTASVSETPTPEAATTLAVLPTTLVTTRVTSITTVIGGTHTVLTTMTVETVGTGAATSSSMTITAVDGGTTSTTGTTMWLPSVGTAFSISSAPPLFPNSTIMSPGLTIVSSTMTVQGTGTGNIGGTATSKPTVVSEGDKNAKPPKGVSVNTCIVMLAALLAFLL